MNEADDLARRVAETLLRREGTGTAWGISIDDVREGYARIRMTLRDDMLNGHRIGHGGMIFALADTAFAYACNSRNENTVAQNASISFLAPAQPGEVLIAEARELSRAGRSGVYRVAVRSADGHAIAEFTGLSRLIGGPIIN
ncbi:MAG: hydroxyphenylacetyl-CoA thioesterase PaaI [Hyphomonadaceae bacterium]